MSKLGKDFYIYGHYTVDTKELFYIGKGRGRRHLRKTGRNIVWQRIVKKHEYLSKILINNLEESDAFIQEILGIKEFSPKANLTKGGEGVVGMVPWNKGKKLPQITGVNNPMYGKHIKDFMTDKNYQQWKTNATKHLIGGVKSPEEREAMSKRTTGCGNPMYNKTPWNKGKAHSAETRNKISLAAKDRKVVRKKIEWVEKQSIYSAVEISKILKSHPQSIRQAAREGILHKGYRFRYV